MEFGGIDAVSSGGGKLARLEISGPVSVSVGLAGANSVVFTGSELDGSGKERAGFDKVTRVIIAVRNNSAKGLAPGLSSVRCCCSIRLALCKSSWLPPLPVAATTNRV